MPFFHFLGPPAFIVLEVSFWLRFLLPRFAYIEWANAMVPPTSFLGGGAARGVRLDLPPGPGLMRKEWTHGRTGTAAQRPWFDS